MVAVPVAALVAADEADAGAMTGSPVVVVDVPLDCALAMTEDAADDTAADEATEVEDAAAEQPERHPLETRQ